MKNESKKTRTECDLLGCVEVPDNVLYGVQTMRGLENFAISKFRLCEYPRFIEGLAIVKLGAAIANHAMGLLSDELFGAISQACREIMAGRFHEFFPVDMIQGGAGTTTNMNANEVIANRALEIMGHARGEYQYCSPNDHVNCSQSTNDAYPSAIHLGLYATHLELRRHLEALIAAFARKGDEFARVLKMGRTQLQDAVPMTLGQTFHGFASVLRGEVDNLDHAAQEFLSINMGATAIGTGICAEPGYAERCTAAIREITGWDVTLAEDLVGATSDTVCMVGYSSAMKRIASKMNKICNDLRLLSSGPRCGLGEFNLPARQPGSSIMPGKVNPVIPGDYWIAGCFSAIVLQNACAGNKLTDANGNAIWVDTIEPFEVSAETYDLYEKYFMDQSVYTEEEIQAMVGISCDEMLSIINDYSLDSRLMAKYEAGIIPADEMKAAGYDVQ